MPDQLDPVGITPVYRVVNPATGERGADYEAVGASALERVIADAARAATGWSVSSDVSERAALLRRVAALHAERREDLAAIIVAEIGKPVTQSLAEVDFAAEIYAFYADNAERLLADTPIPLSGDAAGSASLRRAPLGPLLGIMPWNFPYYQVARFAAPNLAIGNPILLKPAPQCPESAAAIERIFTDAGFPDGAYVNVYADNHQVATMIADPRLRGVSLTGSERAGAAVAEIAGRNLKKVVLELGGSDPFILLSTDDLDGAVEMAVAARLENAGQACNAAKRFLIIDDLYEAFVERFVLALGQVKVGDPARPETEMGPLSSDAAADRLALQVEQAVADGATVRLGAQRAGNFYSPTVLTDVGPDNPAYREEFFGPVAVVYRVASESEAIALANDTAFGLGSYVITTDADQAVRVADRIDAGMVFVNLVGADAVELPFGGVKRSGFGRELGALGIDEFVNKKMIRVAPER